MSEDIEMHYCDSCGGSYGYDESKNEKVYQNERNLEAALAKANAYISRLETHVKGMVLSLEKHGQNINVQFHIDYMNEALQSKTHE